MTKKQPLWDIQVLGGEVIFTPGTFNQDAFAAQCLKHDDGYEVQPRDVSYSIARWIPVWENGEYAGHYLDYPVAPKRGAFPITFAETFRELGYHGD